MCEITEGHQRKGEHDWEHHQTCEQDDDGDQQIEKFNIFFSSSFLVFLRVWEFRIKIASSNIDTFYYSNIELIMILLKSSLSIPHAYQNGCVPGELNVQYKVKQSIRY